MEHRSWRPSGTALRLVEFEPAATQAYAYVFDAICKTFSRFDDLTITEEDE